MEVKIDEINGTLTINGNTHEFLIGDDGDVVSEWVKSPNKNEENGNMLVAELLYIANVRQGNKQIERATNIRELAEFIKQNLKFKMMAGKNTGNNFGVGSLYLIDFNGKSLFAEVVEIKNDGNLRVRILNENGDDFDYVLFSKNDFFGVIIKKYPDLKVGDTFVQNKGGKESKYIITELSFDSGYDPYEARNVSGQDVKMQEYSDGVLIGEMNIETLGAMYMLLSLNYKKINEDGGNIDSFGFNYEIGGL